ncbi:MAG: DNA polymerase IV, partial [Gammaproteobacteria bacterium]|nr:DNA polymerase IV [Gammaproteobacteria bacterium]
HDFTQTTLEQSGAGLELEDYSDLLAGAFARGKRPVRLIGVGVRLIDLRSGFEQLRLF